MQKFPLTIILDNVRSAYNVGSVLRTAECAGIEAVVTCGYTPKSTHHRVVKTALGAENIVDSSHFSNLSEAIENYLDQNYDIYVLETGEEAKSLWDQEFSKQKPTAFIFGNEVEGVQMDVIKKYKLPILEIPMFGQKQSLNIANASAIAIYDLIKIWHNWSKQE